MIEGSTQGRERGVRRWREGGGRQAEESLPHRAEELARQLETRNPIWLGTGYSFVISYLFAVARCLKGSNLMGEGFVLGGDLRGEMLGVGRRAWQ